MKLQLKLAVFILIVAVITSCSGEGTPHATPVPTLAKSTPTPQWSSCGVALVDHDAKIWVEGNYAEEACGMIVAKAKAEATTNAERPIWWVAERVYSGYVVCSDEFSDLIYEVIDTGGARYGSQWCRWMRSRYGTAPYPVEPDLFNLIEPSPTEEWEEW